jgi:6-phosphogluconolactonase (cycloisomerase 2 family)
LPALLMGCGGGNPSGPVSSDSVHNNPVPIISSISPSSTLASGPAFTLTVSGTGFVSGSIVRWNGVSHNTTFVSATQLTTTITAADVAAAGTVAVTVVNSTPGGGTSVAVNIAINNPVPTIASLSQTSAFPSGPAFTLTVNGTGFVSGSTVQWNGTGRSTTFVNTTQLTAMITAADIAAAETAAVSVVNATPGGGTSAAADFVITIPSPRFGYALNKDNTLSIFTVNADTGHLRANGYVVTGSNPQSVAVDPLQKFAYVANAGSRNISAYTINANTGELTQVAGSPFSADLSQSLTPSSLTLDPSGKSAYVGYSNSGALAAYSIDAGTGALTPVVGSPFSLGGAVLTSITVHPSGRFVYGVDFSSKNLWASTINASTGALTEVAGAPFATGTGPEQVVADPSGKFVYVPNQGSNNISAFSVNPLTGALTPVGGSPFRTGPSPSSIAVDPSGRFAYVSNVSDNTVWAYTIDPSTGALTPVVGTPFLAPPVPVSVTVDPSGKFAYVANANSSQEVISSYAIDPTSGGLTPAGGVQGRNLAGPMAITKGSSPITYIPKFAYVANAGSNDISAFAINVITGALTPVPGAPFSSGVGSSPVSVAVDQSQKFVYAANADSNNISAFTISASSGALTPVAGSPFMSGTQFRAGLRPNSVMVDSSGRFLYVANRDSNNVSAFTIDPSTGALGFVVGSPFGLAFNGQPPL